jgi:hypothetical protein
MKVLDRPVRRLTASTLDCNRPAAVTLHPGDVIGFRLLGQRREFRLSLKAAYHAAVKNGVRHGHRSA